MAAKLHFVDGGMSAASESAARLLARDPCVAPPSMAFHAAPFVPLAAAALGASALVLQRSRAPVVEFPAVEEAVEEAA